MNEWGAQELRLQRHCWPSVVHAEGTEWCKIAAYAFPSGWSRTEAEIAFKIPDGLPGQEPYAFWVRDGLVLASTNAAPSNYTFPVAPTPWGGQWGQFSWNLDPWAPGPQPGDGTSMVDFVRSFSARLRELN